MSATSNLLPPKSITGKKPQSGLLTPWRSAMSCVVALSLSVVEAVDKKQPDRPYASCLSGRQWLAWMVRAR